MRKITYIFLIAMLLMLALPCGVALADGNVSIDDVRVFKSYDETDDWLIAVRYNNSDADFAPYTDPSETWALQLRDDTDAVVAQQPVRMWGIRPGSIYLNADSASALEWATNYSVVMHSLYNSSYDYTYNMSALNWFGSSMSQLDSWCIYTAKLMENEDSETYTIATIDYGDVINLDGMSLFLRGIPGLDDIRPDLFYVTEFEIGEWETSTYTGAYETELSDYETALGVQLSAILNDQEAITHLSGRWMGGLIVFAIFVIVAGLGVKVGHFGGGMAVGSLVILGGVMVGLIPLTALFVVLALGLVVFVKAVIWDRGAS